MTSPVPRLEPRRRGRGVRLLGLVVPGMREVAAQIGPYTEWWNERNQSAAVADGPLLVVVGDSTAIGIGATAPDRGYAGLVHRGLQEHDHRSWRVINLALSGARVQDALDRQLPVLERLTPDRVICCVGTNDVVWGRDTVRLASRMTDLVSSLPPETIVASVAGTSARARLANRTLNREAAERALVSLNPWNEPGPPAGQRIAADRFHPNDLGYELMAQAFGRELGLPEPVVDSRESEAGA